MLGSDLVDYLHGDLRGRPRFALGFDGIRIRFGVRQLERQGRDRIGLSLEVST